MSWLSRSASSVAYQPAEQRLASARLEKNRNLRRSDVDHVGVSLATDVGDGLTQASQHLKSGTQRCRIPVCLRPSGETSCSGSCDSRFLPIAARLISRWPVLVGWDPGVDHHRDPAGQHRSGDWLFPSRPAFCAQGISGAARRGQGRSPMPGGIGWLSHRADSDH